MDTILIGLGGTVLGALVAWALSYFLPSRDATRLADARERIARIEEERNEWETRYRKLVGFSPRTRIIGQAPDHQFIEVTANQERSQHYRGPGRGQGSWTRGPGPRLALTASP